MKETWQRFFLKIPSAIWKGVLPIALVLIVFLVYTWQNSQSSEVYSLMNKRMKPAAFYEDSPDERFLDQGCYSASNPQIVFYSRSILPASQKNVLPTLQPSNVINKYQYPCREPYVGRTSQGLLEIMHLHIPMYFTYGGEKFRKQFAYYVLVEECVSKYLLEPLALGNGSLMDVYILSFRRPCKSPSTPEHFVYLFNNRSTWSTGRNLLFYHVQDSGRKYYYHIFIDDDVELFYTETYLKFLEEKKILPGSNQAPKSFLASENYAKFVREIKNGLSPWRYYESILIEMVPAYAVINLITDFGDDIRLLQKSHFEKVCPKGMAMPWITPSVYIDTRIIGYHYKALPILLPYNLKGESIHWAISAVYTIYRTMALFYKQAITIWSLSSINARHASYPRGRFPDDYLEQYFQAEGGPIKEILDIRDRDFVMFSDNGKWRDVFFHDRFICTAPIKFPITDHYIIPEKFKKRLL